MYSQTTWQRFIFVCSVYSWQFAYLQSWVWALITLQCWNTMNLRFMRALMIFRIAISRSLDPAGILMRFWSKMKRVSHIQLMTKWAIESQMTHWLHSLINLTMISFMIPLIAILFIKITDGKRTQFGLEGSKTLRKKISTSSYTVLWQQTIQMLKVSWTKKSR